MSNTYSVFGLHVYQQNSEPLQQLLAQHPTSLHGDKLWDASFLLMQYLLEHPLAENSRVLDLGCGWGLLSIFLSLQGNYHITALDADANVEAYLQAHAQLNQVAAPTFKQARFEQLTHEDLQPFDVILAADVCFWDELTETHQNLIDLALEAGVKTIIYSDPMRPPFHDLVDYCCEEYFAEAFELRLEKPHAMQGAVMIIENS